ncbi:MAG TPA: helix-turn-helix transcriptional regulator [Vicinamibacterales bacterium]|jgi:transcriptional regulator with XRE-family HTH domain|nr:helix-turn-helix transcriptional regulator [Vicinamibacterales bacterium]
MSEPTTLGSWLRRERERRGVTLAKISEETKVAVPLLEGLEGDDLSRWPGGIFRRAFARSYATAIGLDPELLVRRVEEEHPSEPVAPTTGPAETRAVAPPSPKLVDSTAGRAQPVPQEPGTAQDARPMSAARALSSPLAARLQATALDLLVAGSIGLGFAAAGSRLLWPVIAIAAYHSVGLLLTGTTPMMALLLQHQRPAGEPTHPATAVPEADAPVQLRRIENEPRHVRRARGRRTARSEHAAGSRR